MSQYKRQENYAARMEAAGMVRVVYWVPAGDRETVSKYIARLRKAALRAAQKGQADCACPPDTHKFTRPTD